MTPATRLTRVVVVDDSSVARARVRRRLEQEGDIEVVATAANARAAIDAIDANTVDVCVADAGLPGLERLIARPLRVILLDSQADPGRTLEALRFGLGDFVPIDDPGSLDRLVSIMRGLTGHDDPVLPTEPERPGRFRPRLARIVVIGASTGGPRALQAVLAGLPDGLPAPVAVVQHMPDAFLSLLAHRLGRESGRDVRMAGHRVPMEAGVVYLAPGEQHLEVVQSVDGPAGHLTDDPPEHFCRPAVNPLFRSAARMFGASACAVVLTGMGEDGCTGAAAVAAAGGTVLVQDEASSVVWGMPGAVVRAGIAPGVVPLDRMGAAIAAAAGVTA